MENVKNEAVKLHVQRPLINMVEKELLKLQKGNVVSLEPTVSEVSYYNPLALTEPAKTATNWEEQAQRVCTVLQKLGASLKVDVPENELAFTKELLIIRYEANEPHTIKSLYESLKANAHHNTPYTQAILKLIL
ncbi:hypothetical protein [Solibacillus sp. NPDC093137]|uniref:hypothetical protein n=1 Tax=Solibacillus sp. NPDC093137 TaxID=3390678 RepID=UPI003D0266B2